MALDGVATILKASEQGEIFNLVKPEKLINEISREFSVCPKPVIKDKFAKAVKDLCKDCNALSLEFTAFVSNTEFSDNSSVCIDLSDILQDKFRISGVGRVKTLDWEDIPSKINTILPINRDLYPGFYFQLFSENRKVRLMPVCGDNFKMQMVVYLFPEDPVGSIPEILLNDFQDAITFKTKADLFEVPGRSWSNPEASLYYQRKYSDEIGNSLIAFANRFNRERKRLRQV